MKTIKRRKQKSAKLEPIISLYHEKKNYRLFNRVYGKGKDIMKIYPSLGLIFRVNGSFERNNVIFWDKRFLTVGVSHQTESST